VKTSLAGYDIERLFSDDTVWPIIPIILQKRSRARLVQPSAHYAQKTVAFHFEFGSEIIETARYEMQTLSSWENLQLANKALGRYEEK